MDKSTAAENTMSKPVASEEQRGIRTAELFNAANLGAAVVVCAMSGAKTPPWEGD